jgi:hypothetical protein
VEPTATLQISGKVMNENDYVRTGAFHTLDLEGKLPWCEGVMGAKPRSQSRFQTHKRDGVGLGRFGEDHGEHEGRERCRSWGYSMWRG